MLLERGGDALVLVPRGEQPLAHYVRVARRQEEVVPPLPARRLAQEVCVDGLGQDGARVLDLQVEVLGERRDLSRARRGLAARAAAGKGAGVHTCLRVAATPLIL